MSWGCKQPEKGFVCPRDLGTVLKSNFVGVVVVVEGHLAKDIFVSASGQMGQAFQTAKKGKRLNELAARWAGAGKGSGV